MKTALLLIGVACCLPAQESALDREVQQAIAEKQFPGAVLVVVRDGKVLHRKAYGNRSLEPTREAMTLDTVFDAASLTKIVATTSSLMKLFEQGKFNPADPVTKYLPEFQGGKSSITVRDLMTHFSGLRPDLDLTPPWSGYETGINKALLDKPTGAPGEKFIYSDINFELLGEIVRRVSGKPLDQFARDEIFTPLGMRETMFRPPDSLKSRIAPTAYDESNNTMLRGVVHDPTARYMGGIAGHAGLFTTAADLMLYAQALVGGTLFKSDTVQRFTSPASPSGQPVLYGLGFDIDSPYSSPRGELFPIGSFGHTGFTGTSLWIDSASKSYWILLTNRVHPRGGPNIAPIRRRLGTIIASSFHGVHTGLDVLAAQNFAPIQGRRVGLITNHTGVDREGRRNIDLMRAAGVRLTALFSPEHGITGKEDRNNVGDAIDPSTGLIIHSLYNNGNTRVSPQMLRDVDALVFDIQDIGSRFYTYTCTMLYALEEAAKLKIPYYVLDRPNPVTGMHVEGPILDADLQSFVGCFQVPVRHGLTMGELATMANAERKLGAQLNVVKMTGWKRSDWFDSTGLTWIDPSPNMRSLNAATLYPGIALIEGSRNYSVGRGADAPFEQIGADWIRGIELAQFINAQDIPGISVYPTRFTPNDSVFKGKAIEGVRFVVTDRETFYSVRFGLEVARALQRLYPGKIDFEQSKSLIGTRWLIDALKRGGDLRIDLQRAGDDVAAFLERRAPFLLY